MQFIGNQLRRDFTIFKLFSVHYFEYTKDFSFSGESHDFWEFVYVDKGAIQIHADEEELNLVKGDIFFHQPNEFHTLKADGKIAPNLVIISFSSKSSAMRFFRRKLCKIGNEEKNLLARILHEAGNAFSSDLSDPLLPELIKREEQAFGSEQLIRLYLEQFLISLVRKEMHLTDFREIATPVKEQTQSEAFDTVVDYFEHHLDTMPDFQTVCRETGFSSTYIQQVFKEKTGRSVMEYYKLVKLEHAKDMIREGDWTFTEIAERLNYSSIYYFSKVFKRYIGMTPSEYASSVKLIL